MARNSRSKRNKEAKLIITIENGLVEIESVGFVGEECVGDTINRQLRKIGVVKSLERQPGDERPVEDVNVIGVGN